MRIQLTNPGNLSPKGYEKIADVSSAVGLTVPIGASLAYLQAHTGPIRFRDDGTNPTSTTGMLLIEDTEPVLYTGDLGSLRFIDDGSTTGELNVLYYAYSGN